MTGTPQSADIPQDSPITHLDPPHQWRAPELTRRPDLRARIDRALGLIARARSDSLIRNGVFSTATQVVNSAFGYVFWLLAAHAYSPATVGLTAAATSATSIVLMLSCLGVGGMLIQSLPRQDKQTEWSATFWAGMATVTLFAAALCGAGVAALPLISPELAALRGVGFAAAFAVGTVALTLGTTLDCVFLAERRASYAFTRNFSVGLVKVLMLGFLALAFGPDAVRLLGAWGLGAVVGLGTGVALLARHIGVARPPGFSVLMRTARGFRSRVTLHQLIGLGAGLLTYLLPLIVTVRLSARENAYFYTTWMLAALFLVIAPAFSNNLFAEGMHRPEELGALGAIMVPGLVAILVLGGTMLSAFGHAYSGHAVGLLRLVVLASIPDAVVHVYVGVLRAEARLVAAASLLVGIGVGTVLISWFLLPVIGISAVGYAFLAMQLCGCAYVFLDWRRRVSGARAHSGRGIR
jgi:O-antigen/teichoic acid export membrane protein